MFRRATTRRGGTLVEVLVAAALCILGMWLLTWVYQQGMDTFRNGRAQADLTGQQRMAATLLMRDLKADHFMDEPSKPNGGRRLSDQRMDQVNVQGGYVPPRAGYFRAGSFPTVQADLPPYTGNVFEGSDGINSTRSINHFLQFTVLLPGASNAQTFSAEVPAGGGPTRQYYSTVAEVMYYLRPAGTTPSGIPLFDLYRQQRISAPTSDFVSAYAAPASQADAFEVMTVFGGQMRTLRDLTVPQGYTNPNCVRMTPGTPIGSAPNPPSARIGEDKLLSSVLSFEVKFTGVAGPGSGVNWPAPYTINPDYPYDTLPYDGIFDTHTQLNVTPSWRNDIANPTNINRRLKPLRITGAQIRIRTYEARTRQTRQTTFTVDL